MSELHTEHDNPVYLPGFEILRLIGAEPYICTNAGTGSPEEMSDWVEYCNLPSEGKWAKLRIENGHPEPYKVKYWSIGNENYGDWEMGAKNLKEWGRFVKESAKRNKSDTNMPHNMTYGTCLCRKNEPVFVSYEHCSLL